MNLIFKQPEYENKMGKILISLLLEYSNKNFITPSGDV